MKPILFLIPIIALTLTGLLFYYFLKKSSNKKVYYRLVYTISALAFLFNLIWELIQIPLYKAASYRIEHIAFCVLASIADAILVMLLFFGSAVIFRNLFWIRDKKWHQILIIICSCLMHRPERFGVGAQQCLRRWHQKKTLFQTRE